MVPSIDPNGRNPHQRLSITLAGISASRLAVFTVAGETKRSAVHDVLQRGRSAGQPSARR